MRLVGSAKGVCGSFAVTVNKRRLAACIPGWAKIAKGPFVHVRSSGGVFIYCRLIDCLTDLASLPSSIPLRIGHRTSRIHTPVFLCDAALC